MTRTPPNYSVMANLSFRLKSTGSGNAAAAGLSSFRVYRREPAAAYRETITRRDRDRLPGIASANAARWR
jgi:hypothetical protein